MITRRKFVQTSLAASAVALTGCGNETQKTPENPPAAPAANAELRLYFVGGTVFVQDGTTILGVQPSGKNQSYNGHSLEHASYIAGPGFAGPALPSRLTASRSAFAGWKSECLVGKTVTVTGKKDKAMNKCAQLADYNGVADQWVRKGDWDPKKNDAINSIFKLMDGDLVDDKAMNQTAAKVKWWVKDKGKKKDLSDVAVLEVKAAEITISGLTNEIVIKSGDKLELAVFAGPLELHPKGYKYLRISHALLLKTIYDVKNTPDYDIMPTTENEVDGDVGEEMDNPCPSTKQEKIRVPPDSEYCPNYGGTP